MSVPGPRFSGLLLVDKPVGPTSHDAVLWARRAFGTDRVGHAGSLDPRATGLLLLLFGEALSWQNLAMGERKVYSGVFRFGVATDTDDLAGKPIPTDFRRPPEELTEAEVRDVFARFQGPQEQEVPRYAAVKVRGRPLYVWARKGISVPLPKKSIDVYRLDLLSYTTPDAAFRVDCSKGTYVRSLARDIGAQLGVGGTLAALRRESIGDLTVDRALAWDGGRDAPIAGWERGFLSLGDLTARWGKP
jgi:tRNA pseudouridine55 synthase